jgi:hypothetical protein
VTEPTLTLFYVAFLSGLVPARRLGYADVPGMSCFFSCLPTIIKINAQPRSGKSSIVLALYRALDRSLVDGTIKIDGVDINVIPLSLLRRSLRYVSATSG